ncbi:hypothetical protein GQ54DRAFT_16958 [Martensiomyces pterosporus]|nr:hypothetical protein GQ54DRAFT_16958 [Martensiomyces pterosporus]
MQRVCGARGGRSGAASSARRAVLLQGYTRLLFAHVALGPPASADRMGKGRYTFFVARPMSRNQTPVHSKQGDEVEVGGGNGRWQRRGEIPHITSAFHMRGACTCLFPFALQTYIYACAQILDSLPLVFSYHQHSSRSRVLQAKHLRTTHCSGTPNTGCSGCRESDDYRLCPLPFFLFLLFQTTRFFFFFTCRNTKPLKRLPSNKDKAVAPEPISPLFLIHHVDASYRKRKY